MFSSQIYVFNIIVAASSWRLVKDSKLISEGTSFHRLSQPTSNILIGELEALKSGIQNAIRCRIKNVKILATSTMLTSIFMDHHGDDNLLLSQLSVSDHMSLMPLIMEVNQLKKTFQYFDIELISFNTHINELQLMIDNNIVNFQRKDL